MPEIRKLPVSDEEIRYDPRVDNLVTRHRALVKEKKQLEEDKASVEHKLSTLEHNSAIRERLRDEKILELEKQIKEQTDRHARELDENTLEINNRRLRQQVRDLAAELNSKREESRLEIKMDMLLAASEALQNTYTAPEEDIRGNMQAALRILLRAGGATIVDDNIGGETAYIGGKHRIMGIHQREQIPNTDGKVFYEIAPAVYYGNRLLLHGVVSEDKPIPHGVPRQQTAPRIAAPRPPQANVGMGGEEQSDKDMFGNIIQRPRPPHRRRPPRVRG